MPNKLRSTFTNMTEAGRELLAQLLAYDPNKVCCCMHVCASLSVCMYVCTCVPVCLCLCLCRCVLQTILYVYFQAARYQIIHFRIVSYRVTNEHVSPSHIFPSLFPCHSVHAANQCWKCLETCLLHHITGTHTPRVYANVPREIWAGSLCCQEAGMNFVELPSIMLWDFSKSWVIHAPIMPQVE